VEESPEWCWERIWQAGCSVMHMDDGTMVLVHLEWRRAGEIYTVLERCRQHLLDEMYVGRSLCRVFQLDRFWTRYLVVHLVTSL
jgi:hypothetical protein